ncbi:MAG: transposase [bacterium]|nr:transposase [bacterium]
MSGFHEWDQKDHAESWMLFPHNLGSRLAIDEVELTNGELYTIVTNKAAHGKKGALVAMVEGTRAEAVATVLCRIPALKRGMVGEVTLDLSPAMESIARTSFPRARITSDRFHVQQLVSEALQDIRVELRKEALKQEAEAIIKARAEKHVFVPKTHANSDTDRQLLARSRYVLFKPESRWHESQKERAEILFARFPNLKHAYNLSMLFRSMYENCTDKVSAKEKLDAWYQKIESSRIKEFEVPMMTIRAHEDTILNYFVERSTNASAESFNAKLKGFRAVVRGVRDKKFFLFRVAMLYG